MASATKAGACIWAEEEPASMIASATNNGRNTLADGELGSDQQALLSVSWAMSATAAAPSVLRRRRNTCLAAAAAIAIAGLVRSASLGWHEAVQKSLVGPAGFKAEDAVQYVAFTKDDVLEDEDAVKMLLSGLSDISGGKEAKRWWVGMKMHNVKSIKSLKALHKYYSMAGAEGLFGGPYADQEEGQRARKVIEWGLHKYDGDDWKEYMNEEKATRKPPKDQVGVGSTASLISQVYPPNEKFVILVLAWLPIGKYPWAGHGGVGAAHTHGQATCNFKFLNAVEGAGNTFYDIAGGASKVTDMFEDGKPHKGGCKDHDYVPILVNPEAGREFIHSKDLMGNTSGFIQDDNGAHSIDNLNTTHIAYSVHVYYPPYAEAWAFHEKLGIHGQKCLRRAGDGGKGLSNCENTHHRKCTATSMKQYLEAARDLKKFEAEHRDEAEEEASGQWFRSVFRQVTSSLMEKDVSADDSLDE
eukprot:CAMPEP_0171069912 /NCGR_PEP_ID=MMETSP0766_2-20121228/9427_1 /TAXON_ID=439317 /ORGANISM="Gambierdiscus australes, Strain CAWD 149" /LENGTH=470 /DNA_ID=CAMNT_0011526331 /DNA_START=65 /DNA_END=1477 /DNA_ORIENTATION=-